MATDRTVCESDVFATCITNKISNNNSNNFISLEKIALINWFYIDSSINKHTLLTKQTNKQTKTKKQASCSPKLVSL